MRLRRSIDAWFGAALVSIGACSGPASVQPQPSAALELPEPALVGSSRCADCHPSETQAWRRSHHAQSMQVASADTVLARSEAPSGAKYTLGVYPLQQYLVPGARGRLDVSSRAWDARPAADGGQRWFWPAGAPPSHAQNWNGECAACHSTGLRRRYDLARDSFDTRWAEVNVGCEACHGPGSRHIAWAEAEPGRRPSLVAAGFVVPLRAASALRWRFRAGDPIARADEGHAASASDASAEVNRCVACHARRVEISAEPQREGRLLDAYAPNLIEAGLYQVDGQLDDENFEYGSFVQSRMSMAGVTCSNCHEPHEAKLRAEGNALCAQCHEAKHFDAASHHHHAEGSEAARCVSCHMPKHTFMGIDERRDHYIRPPRPDLTVKLGTPNACNDCHLDKSAAWAAEVIAAWGGGTVIAPGLVANASDAVQQSSTVGGENCAHVTTGQAEGRRSERRAQAAATPDEQLRGRSSAHRRCPQPSAALDPALGGSPANEQRAPVGAARVSAAAFQRAQSDRSEFEKAGRRATPDDVRRGGSTASQQLARVASALDAGRRGLADANAQLALVVLDPHVPAIQRASAAALLRDPLDADARHAWESAATADDDLVRLGAARALERLRADERTALGSPLLSDPARGVRIEVARALAGVPLEQLEPSHRPQLHAALGEWLAARAVVVDRPDTHVDVAQVYARRGELARAERELQTALDIDPENLPARINLADLYRATGHDADAERLLRQTVEAQPRAAIAWHALGLALVRLNRREEALSALAKASELAPSDRDYATTYAVALREVRGQHPNDSQRRPPQRERPSNPE